MLKKLSITLITLFMLVNVCLADTEAIWGDYKIVGDTSHNSSQGKAVIYIRQGDTWKEIQTITASDAENSDLFGCSVAIHNDFIVVGARYEDNVTGQGDNSGAAYVFQRNGNKWEQVKKLIASSRQQNAYFGYDVSIYNDYYIIGAYYEDSRKGAAYIFKKKDSTWLQVARLTANDRDNTDEFGFSVAITDTTAVIGARRDDDLGSDFGAVYIFRNQNDTWLQASKIQGSGNYFGTHVAIKDNTIIVKNNAGLAYYYPFFITVSGYINTPKNHPQIGTTITFTNEGGSTSTDSSGYFSLQLPIGYSGIAVPSQNGYKFSPASMLFNNLVDNAFDQHFTAQRLTITGFIKDKDNKPLPGVLLIFSNQSGETITDDNGKFIHDVDYNWSGTITPQLAGVDFEPQLHTYSSIIDNQHAQNFISTPRLYNIGGYITDQDNQPLENVKVCDGINCDNTDSNGYYEMIVNFMDDIDVTPVKKGYSFLPESIPYTRISEDKPDSDFSAEIHHHVISGTVLDPDQQPIPGVKIQVNDGEEVIDVDAQGHFKLEKRYDWSGVLVFQKFGYVFDAMSLTITHLTNDMPDIHITGDRERVTISGHVTYESDPVENARLKFSHLGICTTDSNGNYTFDVPHGWTGKVEIFKLDLDFVPTDKLFQNVTSPTELDFVAYNQKQSAIMALPDYHEVPASAGFITVQVHITPTDMEWSFVKSSQSWVHMTAKGDQLSITYDKNTETYDRTAIISIQATDAANSPQQITVIQEGQPEPVPGPGWDKLFQPEMFQYQQLITAIVEDDQGQAMDYPGSMLAAFCDDELRGVAMPIETTFGHRYFLQVFSNQPSDEEIRFMHYDARHDRVNVNIRYPITFAHTSSMGHVMTPHCLTISDYFVRMALNRYWNWISINALNQNMSVNNVMASLGNKGILAIQQGFAQYLPEYKSWSGNLQTIDHLSMIMLKTTDPVFFEFSGNALDLPNTPIALTTGWNRLAYLPSEEMPLKNALESIEGNALKIVSQYGVAEYVVDHGWFGPLQTLYPNRGYLIYMSNEDVLIYPTQVNKRARTRSLRQNTTYSVNGWVVDPSQYEHQATLTGIVVINQQALGSTGDSLVAIANGECRGIASPIDTPNGIRYFLQIWSNDNDNIQLKFYDASDQQVYELRQSIEFRPNLSMGSVESPERLDNAPELLCDLDVSKYQFQGTIVANVTRNGEILDNPDDQLMVRVNEECRGVAIPTETPYGNRFFLHVWSNTATQMQYQFYHAGDDSLHTLTEPLNYSPNMELGTVEKPFSLEISPSNCDKCEKLLTQALLDLSKTTDELSQTQSELTQAKSDLEILDQQLDNANKRIDYLEIENAKLTIYVNQLIGFTIDVSETWILVGGGNIKAYPTTIPENSIDAMFIYKDNQYEVVDHFPPRQGVWVKLNQPCQLSVEGVLE